MEDSNTTEWKEEPLTITRGDMVWMEDNEGQRQLVEIKNGKSKLDNLKTDKKSKHGGLRENAGRKPKLNFQAREIFYAKIDERWDKLIAVLDKFIEKEDKDMVKFMIEQRIGKAPQRMEITGEGGEVLKITVIPYDGKSNNTPQVPN